MNANSGSGHGGQVGFKDVGDLGDSSSSGDIMGSSPGDDGDDDGIDLGEKYKNVDSKMNTFSALDKKKRKTKSKSGEE